MRRQTMSAQDYARLLDAPASATFPTNLSWSCASATISRYFARQIIDPTASDSRDGAAASRRTIRATSRPTTRSTAVNFRAGRSVVGARPARGALSAAGGPGSGRACRSIRPSPSRRRFCERCHGLFYLCAGGAEARRFNRLLIDAGLIKGMVSR